MGLLKGIGLSLLPSLYKVVSDQLDWLPTISGFDWFLLTFLTIFASLLWIIAGHAQKIEEQKLLIFTGNDRVFRSKEKVSPARYETSLRVGVKNSSLRENKGVELVLANVVSKDGSETRDPSLSLSAIGNDKNYIRVTINPHDIKYYTVAKLIEPENVDNMTAKEIMEYLKNLKENPYSYIEVGGLIIKEGIYRLKLKVSSEISPSSRMHFLIGFDENGQVIFEPEVINVTR